MSLPRRLAGARAKAAGDAFETWLAYQHAAALRLGYIAWIRHVSPRMRPFKSGPHLRWAAVGEACCDYVGCTATGRAIVVEAKSTADKALHYSQLEPQQIAQLDATDRVGGKALIVVEFRAIKGAPRYAVEWDLIPWAAHGRGHSIAATALEDMGARIRDGVNYLVTDGA